MMRYRGEDKVAAALDDLLAYLQCVSENKEIPNMNSVTIKKAIRSLEALDKKAA